MKFPTIENENARAKDPSQVAYTCVNDYLDYFNWASVIVPKFITPHLI